MVFSIDNEDKKDIPDDTDVYGTKHDTHDSFMYNSVMSDFSNLKQDELIELYKNNKIRFAGVTHELYRPQASGSMASRQVGIQISGCVTIAMPRKDYENLPLNIYLAWVPEMSPYSFFDVNEKSYQHVREHHTVKLVHYDTNKLVNAKIINGKKIEIKPHHIVGKLQQRCHMAVNGIYLQLCNFPTSVKDDSLFSFIYEFKGDSGELEESVVDEFSTKTLSALYEKLKQYAKNKLEITFDDKTTRRGIIQYMFGDPEGGTYKDNRFFVLCYYHSHKSKKDDVKEKLKEFSGKGTATVEYYSDSDSDAEPPITKRAKATSFTVTNKEVSAFLEELNA